MVNAESWFDKISHCFPKYLYVNSAHAIFLWWDNFEVVLAIIKHSIKFSWPATCTTILRLVLSTLNGVGSR